MRRGRRRSAGRAVALGVRHPITGMARLLLAALLLLSAAAEPALAQRELNERHAAPPRGAIRIHHFAGSIRVTGWDRDSIVVTGVARERGGDRFYISVGANGSKLGLWPQRSDSLPPSDIIVRVPHGSSVWVKTVDASITLQGVTGGVDLYSVAGRIEVAGNPRELYAESMSGAIAADVVTRAVRLKTATGAIDLAGRIDDTEAQTVSGTLRVRGGAIGRGRFESVDGDVLYTGGVGRTADLDFVSHAGAVRLDLPAATAADVSVNSYEGALTSGFESRVLQASTGFKGRDYTTTLNGGGARISVRTFKGDVVLRPR